MQELFNVIKDFIVFMIDDKASPSILLISIAILIIVTAAKMLPDRFKEGLPTIQINPELPHKESGFLSFIMNTLIVIFWILFIFAIKELFF